MRHTTLDYFDDASIVYINNLLDDKIEQAEKVRKEATIYLKKTEYQKKFKQFAKGLEELYRTGNTKSLEIILEYLNGRANKE